MEIELGAENFGINKSEVNDLGELVSIIVDYYCFKENVSDEEEGDEWKRKLKDDTKENIVPKNIDKLIEQAFASQLKRFSTIEK